MAHASGDPPQTPRRPTSSSALKKILNVLVALIKPRGGRVLILGVSLAVGGVGGCVRTLSGGDGYLTGLALLALGIAGIAIAVACVLDYAKR